MKGAASTQLRIARKTREQKLKVTTAAYWAEVSRRRPERIALLLGAKPEPVRTAHLVHMGMGIISTYYGTAEEVRAYRSKVTRQNAIVVLIGVVVLLVTLAFMVWPLVQRELLGAAA